MFKQTCRTCLSTRGEMVPIFSSGFYVSQLPKKLMAFTRLEISENDGLPKVICKKCLFLAESFYCFKEQCESADNQLKFLLKNKLSNKDTLIARKTPDSQISGSGSCGLGFADSFGGFANFLSSNEKQQHNKRNAFTQPRGIEDDYVVEYISDEVRIEVENAMKRRQEAERRIGMEKVSHSVRNLEGIEVVPVTDLCAGRHEKSSDRKKEDIVVFPVTVSRKRSKSIESIVIEDPAPLTKRLRLPAETSFTKVDLNKVRNGDSSICGEHKKMNFSTVKKFVKINEEGCGSKDNSQLKNNTNIIIVIDDDNEMEDPQIDQDPKNRMDVKILETILQKQDLDLNESKVERETKVDQRKPERESIQKPEVVGANEISKFSDISVGINSVESEEQAVEKYSICHSETVETMGYFTEEYEEEQAHNSSDDSQGYHLVAKSTVGSIISETDDPTVPDISMRIDGEDMLNYEDVNDKRSGEIFIKNEVSNTNNNCSFSVEKKERENNNSNVNCSVETETNRRPASICSLDSFSCKGTSSALLGVDSSSTDKKYRQKDWLKDIQDNSLKFEDSAIFPYQRRRDTQPQSYRCTTCFGHFESLPAVLKHNVQEHMSDQAPFTCFICDVSFDNKSKLYDHVDEHNGSKPFKCSFCPKTFNMQRKLKRHIHNHINYKSFVCEVCRKSFTKKSSLESHMYLHIGEVPFACNSCDVSFNNKISRQRHVTTAREKLDTVVCKFYNKDLPDNRSFPVHRSVHTGDESYQCRRCLRHGEITGADDPWVERVKTENQSREAQDSDGFWENKLNSEKQSGENGAALSTEIKVHCTKVEIDTKENNSSSCNATVVGDAERKANGQSRPRMKAENFNDGCMEEFTTYSETLAEIDTVVTPITVVDNGEH
ncbi:uncharacterized protein [Neodiprion pinetum]|uniref:uncharacterized protein n=1 Tax=Neodiprion pinetum TaxID=441929 RepID=UPI001EE0F9B7|nr:uncharacterized protein LOC124223237 [Neodiprion pinetum]